MSDVEENPMTQLQAEEATLFPGDEDLHMDKGNHEK